MTCSFASLLALFVLTTRPAAAARPDGPPAPAVLAFDNGLRVVLAPSPGAPRIATTTVIEAGSLDDPEGREGVAHLVEHLWFDSHEPTGPTAWDELHGLGCEIEADTWPEFTRFGAACPPAATDALLALELRRVLRPLAGVEDAALELARRVVAAEEVERDTPDAALHTSVFRALYPVGHPLPARLGRPALASGLGRDEVAAFAEAHYRPEHAVLAVTGGFDAAAVRAWLTTTLGYPTIAPPPRTPRRTPPPFRRALRVAPRALPASLPWPAVSVAWSLPPGGVGFLERELLADHVWRALWVRYRHDPRVIELGCADDAQVLATPLVCLLGLADDVSAEEVAADVHAAVDGFWSGAEAGRMRDLFAASRSQALLRVRATATSVDASGGLADSLAISVLLGGTGASLEAAAGAVRAASVGDVLRAGRTHLGAERALVVAWKPTPQARPALGATPDPAPPPRAAAAVPSPPPGVPVVAERTLPNGLRVLALQRADLSFFYAVARVAWPRPASDGARGLLSERSDGAVPASLLHDVVPWSGRFADGEIEGVMGPATDATTVLERLRSRVQARRLYLDAQEPWLLRHREQARRDRADAAWWARVLPAAALDPSGEARARAALVHLDAMAAAAEDDPAELVRHLAGFRPDRTAVVLVGPQAPDVLLDAAARAFGAWSVKGDLPDELPPDHVPPLDLPPLVVVDAPDAPTTTLAWRCPLGGTEAARAVLGELAHARTFAALRADTGWAYGPGAAVLEYEGAPVLAIGAEVPHTRAAAALLAVEGVVDALATGTVDADALARARASWLWANDPTVASPRDTVQFAFGPAGPRSADELRAMSTGVRAVDGAALAATLETCRAGARAALAGPGEALKGALGARAPVVWTVEEARDQVAVKP